MSTATLVRRPAVWVRQLYDWTLRWAASPYGAVALVAVAFAEASFFPIPPDVLLVALCFAKPGRAFHYALLCTLASVLGGLLGWAIGWGLWRSLGVAPGCAEFAGGGWFFANVPGFGCEAFTKVHGMYRDNAGLALFLAAFTPIPYKVFTIASGVFEVPLLTVVLASALGRGGRFVLLASGVHFFGERMRRWLEERFEWMTLLFAVLLIGGFAAIKLVF